jgi:peptide/nickel transport system substrate-binding protein
VVVAYPHEPTTLNPIVADGDAPATRDLVRPLWPGLYRLGPGGTRLPWLLAAEPGPEDVGGTPFAVRLRLRDDAVWSDGRPITAEDVRFTWQAVMATRSAATRDPYDRLADVVVEGPKRVRLVFREAFARWRDLFSAGMGVLPAHAFASPDLSGALQRSWPVSGGPFVLASWTPGLEIVLERNPRAWGEAPLLDRVRIAFVPDVVTALQLFRAGRVDVLGPYEAPGVARRARAAVPAAEVTGDRGATWLGLFLSTRSGPLADLRVRRALALAVDRAGIVEGLVREQGARLDAPSAGDASRTRPSFARYGHDPAAAGRLLDEAGWRSRSEGPRRRGGVDLAITLAAVGSDELLGRISQALLVQAEAAGVELRPVALDADELASWIGSSRFEAALLVERDPPGGALRARFGLPSPRNVSRLDDEALRRAFDEADRTLDDRAPAVAAPFERLAELVPVVPLALLEVTLAARPGVRGVRASAAADGFLAFADRWWREKPGSPSPGTPGPARSPTPTAS